MRESLELLELLLILADVVLLFGFFCDLLLGTFQCLDHVGTRNGLEQILLNAQFDCFSGVLEITVAADDDYLRIRKLAHDDPRQRQTVHKRHRDISNDDIGLQFADHGERHLAVRCITDELEPVFLPRDHVAQTFTHNAFVFANKNLDVIHNVFEILGKPRLLKVVHPGLSFRLTYEICNILVSDALNKNCLIR